MRMGIGIGLGFQQRGGGPDLAAPVIVSTLPADNATGVADTVSPLITFNEDVFPGTGLITLRQNNAGWSDVETFDVATEIGLAPGQVYFSGTGISINPTSNLVLGREYAIRIAGTAVQDGAGNFFVGVANDTTISFTVAAGDVIAPTIVSTSPVDNAVDVDVTSSITITFSENIAFGTGLITLRENNSGWSDLETFDVVTEVGTGNGQVSISGAVLTINPTASLTASREYAIRIAATAIDDLAANSFAGIADDTTISFTAAPGGVPFTARFGTGSFQPSGVGNFDTNLYTASPPANGTYGNFTVTAGVISCNGSQTPGVYDVGGYPVQVLSDFRAVRSLTELNATSGFSGPNRILCIREAAAIDWNNVTSGYGRRANLQGTTLLGDGPPVRDTMWDPAYDSRRHFIRHNLSAMRSFNCDNLRIVSAGTLQDAVNHTATSGGSITQHGDVEYRNCVMIAARPDPNGDYSASWGLGGFGFYIAGTCEGLRLYDNVVIGGYRGYRIVPLVYYEMIGNESWLSYEDAFTISAASTVPGIVGGNIMGVGLARPTDAGLPHGDHLQILTGGSPANHVIEANASFQGNNRGRSFNQNLFLRGATVTGWQTHMRDNVLSGDSPYAFDIFETQGSTMEHCTWAPTPYIALPSGATNGIRFGNEPPFAGSNFLTNVISRTGGTVNAGVTQSGNVTALSAYVAGDWDAMYENWTVDSEQYPTLQKIMADLRAKTTGPGNGKGHRVTFSGPKNSDYVINGGSIPTPTLTSLTMTSTLATGPTANITTDTVLNPIFFAVVPVGTAVATTRDIKHRKVTGALSYGFRSTKNGDTVIALTMAGTGLVAGTQYDVVAFQENGWTKVSAVSRVTFTAT